MYNVTHVQPSHQDNVLENQQYFEISFIKAKRGQLTIFISIFSEPLTVWHVNGQTVDWKWQQKAAIPCFVSLEKESYQ